MNSSAFMWLQTLQVSSDKLCLQLHMSKCIFHRLYFELLTENISPLQGNVWEESGAHNSIYLLSEHGVGAMVCQPQS